MELKVFRDYPELSVAAAATIIECIKNKPRAVLCFASGDTPKLACELVSERTKKENIDVSKCFFIGLDEWLGISPDNTGSCHYFLQHYLFAPMGVDPSRVHLFDAMTTNEEEECERMNGIIGAKNGIDLMVVGVGMNGHIGFNEPGTDLSATAHVAMLDEITKNVGKKYFNAAVTINKGITVGLKQVMQAGTLLMMANGKKKAPVIKRAVEEEPSINFPAGLIRQHNKGILMVDKEAASELETQIQMTRQLIKAFKKDDELIQEMDNLAGDEKNFHLWWLGQSGFLLQWKGKRVLMDPYLSDSLTKKYAATGKPHIRMSEKVMDPELLKNISIITSSHNHTDHLDAETVIPVLENNPGIRFIIPEANRDFVADRVKCDRNFPVGLNDGQSITLEGFTFQGIPAKHNEMERDENGNCRYMGYVIGFGKWRIYHSGDTLWFDEMVDLLKPFAIDVALLPINGNDPARKVAGNLSCREAAELGKTIKAGCVIPCHYDMFTFNTADVNEFGEEAGRINQPFKILKGGERYNSM